MIILSYPSTVAVAVSVRTGLRKNPRFSPGMLFSAGVSADTSDTIALRDGVRSLAGGQSVKDLPEGLSRINRLKESRVIP
jgi:hypothetical protein